jgi:pyrroloquinoline quinone biosynthesis protein D
MTATPLPSDRVPSDRVPSDRVPGDRALRIAPLYRLQWEPAQDCYVLLFPEGMVRLEGGAAEIMKRIDGQTSEEQLIRALEAAFPGAELRADVVEFLEIAIGKGWIRAQSVG